MTARFAFPVVFFVVSMVFGCSSAAAPPASSTPPSASAGGARSADCSSCGWFTPEGPASAAVTGAVCARPIRVSSPDPNMSVDTHGVTDPCAPSCCAR
ncbi:MAG: hypothetical protein U0326_36160 [Polyangiales bacterium]